MLQKKIIPCAQDFGGQDPVQILKISSRGLDKSASLYKRASAFQNELRDLKPREGKAYLHVITTGGMQTYGANRNADGWPERAHDYYPPLMKNASCIHLDGGLQKYHDVTYMRPGKAAVYQQHDVSDDKKCGIIKAAKYNKDMHRGQLIIEVDTDKWASRLDKKAKGQDIYLSVGAAMDHDYCSACGHKAKTFDQHCEHIKKKAGWMMQDGTKVCMINDSPHFYDISGVDVPADQIAFVLKKVASGAKVQDAVQDAYLNCMTRPAMPFSKAAAILDKLAKMEKQIVCKVQDDPIFQDEEKAKKEFLSSVENHNADEVIDQCHRKAILLSPDMLFKLIGKETDSKDLFQSFADSCTCDCHNIMQDMQMDPMFASQLKDGSFDSKLPTDLGLSSTLQKFIPQFGVSRPALNGKAIHISIMISNGARPEKDTKRFKQKLQQKDQQKEKQKETEDQNLQKKASQLQNHFRRTYARYVVSFAERNSQDTCRLALQKMARYR